jgi:hypothetical protein
MANTANSLPAGAMYPVVGGGAASPWAAAAEGAAVLLQQLARQHGGGRHLHQLVATTVHQAALCPAAVPQRVTFAPANSDERSCVAALQQLCTGNLAVEACDTRERLPLGLRLHGAEGELLWELPTPAPGYFSWAVLRHGCRCGSGGHADAPAEAPSARASTALPHDVVVIALPVADRVIGVDGATGAEAFAFAANKPSRVAALPCDEADGARHIAVVEGSVTTSFVSIFAVADGARLRRVAAPRVLDLRLLTSGGEHGALLLLLRADERHDGKSRVLLVRALLRYDAAAFAALDDDDDDIADGAAWTLQGAVTRRVGDGICDTFFAGAPPSSGGDGMIVVAEPLKKVVRFAVDALTVSGTHVELSRSRLELLHHGGEPSFVRGAGGRPQWEMPRWNPADLRRGVPPSGCVAADGDGIFVIAGEPSFARHSDVAFVRFDQVPPPPPDVDGGSKN